MRVAIYIHDRGAQGHIELEHLKEFAIQKNWQIAKIYRKNSAKNIVFRNMLNDAQNAHFDGILFWSLAQFSHDSSLSTLRLLNQLNEWQIKFQSFTEPHFGTCGSCGKTTASVLTTLADIEQSSLSKRISKRTKAGLARQKALGKPGPLGRLGPGRPPTEFDEKLASSLYAKKMTYAAIAKACNVSKAKIWRYFNLPKTSQ
jgi:DNA invertase Pin-like site-specific DNA recombinase